MQHPGSHVMMNKLNNAILLFILWCGGFALCGDYQALAVISEGRQEKQLRFSRQIEQKTLSVVKTIEQIIKGQLDLSDVPDSFYSYYSKIPLKIVDGISLDGSTPLLILVLKSKDEKALKILKHDIYLAGWLMSVNRRYNDDFTVLMVAALYSPKMVHIDAVRFLIQGGAEINAENKNGWTALMLATDAYGLSSDLETIKLLVEFGAAIDWENSDGLSAYKLAEGKSKVLQFFNGKKSKSEFSNNNLFACNIPDYSIDVSDGGCFDNGMPYPKYVEDDPGYNVQNSNNCGGNLDNDEYGFQNTTIDPNHSTSYPSYWQSWPDGLPFPNYI